MSFAAGWRAHVNVFVCIFTDRKHSNLVPSWEQRDVISCLVEVLEPFSTLTDALSGDQTVTISKVVPLLNVINKLCESSEGDSQRAKRIKGSICDYMNSR